MARGMSAGTPQFFPLATVTQQNQKNAPIDMSMSPLPMHLLEVKRSTDVAGGFNPSSEEAAAAYIAGAQHAASMQSIPSVALSRAASMQTIPSYAAGWVEDPWSSQAAQDAAARSEALQQQHAAMSGTYSVPNGIPSGASLNKLRQLDSKMQHQQYGGAMRQQPTVATTAGTNNSNVHHLHSQSNAHGHDSHVQMHTRTRSYSHQASTQHISMGHHGPHHPHQQQHQHQHHQQHQGPYYMQNHAATRGGTPHAGSGPVGFSHAQSMRSVYSHNHIHAHAHGRGNDMGVGVQK